MVLMRVSIMGNVRPARARAAASPVNARLNELSTNTDARRVSWYDAEHDLNDSANRDQLEWLSERLGIDGPPVPGVATGP